VATKPPSPARCILGLIAGFALGGIVLMPVAVLSFSFLFERFTANQTYGFIAVYVLGALLAIWGVWRIRARTDFVSGLITGAAAGLLGLSALCNVLVSGLGTMR
jgi:uncharacterized membrane protein